MAEEIGHLFTSYSALTPAQKRSPDRLNGSDLERLERVRAGVDLRGPSTSHGIDELGAAIAQDASWLRPASREIWTNAKFNLENGRPGFYFRPILLVGRPGTGKSHLARELADRAGLPTTSIDGGGGRAGFGIAGVQRGYATGMAGRPLELILDSRVGNPIVVVDEVDKIGNSNPSDAGTLTTALLSLLEPVSARAWECPYFRVSFDMSHISWILTANDESQVPEALLSRCCVIRIETPSHDELMQFAKLELARRGLGDEDFQALSCLMAAHPQKHRNLRTVTRHLDDLEAITRLPVFH
ncbi:AAA family ATPase [Limimaricola soesokkakensis]|nr:AAA family ATPase [Limimaricola soesokkakensis]